MSVTSEKNIYKSLVLEIRPRLQSVNVLITLVETVKDLSIILNDDSFEIVTEDNKNTISCNNVRIVKNSLSSLIVTENYVSFRFATASSFDNWGSFKTELLKTTQTQPSTIAKSIFLDKESVYSLHCKNCYVNLAEKLQFIRILPLPSENSEPTDWFCHAHGNSSTNFNLNPKESDIFYTQCYCHLMKQSIRNILEKDKLLVCKRCLSWLGLVKNPETVQFWFNTICFKHGETYNSTDSLKDTFNVLREVLNTVLFNSAKVILSCQSSKDHVDYILLWILEKQLNVQLFKINEDVKDCTVAKVLFKFESSCNEHVKQWENEQTVTNLNISKPMFVEFLKSLYTFNKVFPEEFSKSNNFYISYLMMYDDLKDEK